MYLVVTKECIHCKQTGTVMVDEEKYKEFKQTPKHLRRLIQDIFPETSRDLREQLMTGVHPECFQEMFGEEGQ